MARNPLISDIPRQKLCELIARFGQSLCDDPRRCEGLLRDFCGSYRREIHLLVSAAKQRVPAEILSSSDRVPPGVLIARLSKRLRDDLGLAEDFARWTVESWGLALGKLSSADLGSAPSKKRTLNARSTVKSKKAGGSPTPPVSIPGEIWDDPEITPVDSGIGSETKPQVTAEAENERSVRSFRDSRAHGDQSGKQSEVSQPMSDAESSLAVSSTGATAIDPKILLCGGFGAAAGALGGFLNGLLSALHMQIGTAILWHGINGAFIGSGIVFGYFYYFSREYQVARAIKKGAPAGFLAGAMSSALVQALMGMSFSYVFYLSLGEAIVLFGLTGALLGLGLSFTVPYLRVWRAVSGGAAGGLVGAILIVLSNEIGFGSLIGRAFSIALLQGFCLGVMIPVIENAFRKSWLEISYGANRRTVSLGKKWVSIGSDRNACTVYAQNAPAVAFRYKLDEGRITCENVATGGLAAIPAGASHTVGDLRVSVRAAGEGRLVSSPNPKAAQRWLIFAAIVLIIIIAAYFVSVNGNQGINTEPAPERVELPPSSSAVNETLTVRPTPVPPAEESEKSTPPAPPLGAWRSGR